MLDTDGWLTPHPAALPRQRSLLPTVQEVGWAPGTVWTGVENIAPTRIWSDRNEVTETSGRLHPLWPQNKWLHTPRNTDYRHTRQDGWIQTELAFTLAKNATKPNPFEIIPLQTTRKENNWKTEETLARAAVTLETERIKGSNPWCLWWWWPSIPWRVSIVTALPCVPPSQYVRVSCSTNRKGTNLIKFNVGILGVMSSRQLSVILILRTQAEHTHLWRHSLFVNDMF